MVIACSRRVGSEPVTSSVSDRHARRPKTRDSVSTFGGAGIEHKQLSHSRHRRETDISEGRTERFDYVLIGESIHAHTAERLCRGHADSHLPISLGHRE